MLVSLLGRNRRNDIGGHQGKETPMAALIPGGPTLVILLVIVLVIFGPQQLPKLGASLGKTMKSVRTGMDGTAEDEDE